VTYAIIPSPIRDLTGKKTVGIGDAGPLAATRPRGCGEGALLSATHRPASVSDNLILSNPFEGGEPGIGQILAAAAARD